MSMEPDADGGKTPSLGSELIIPVAAILFTLYYFYSIIDTPWTAQVSAFFNGTILLILCVVFIAGVVVKVARGRAGLRFDTLIEPVDIAPKRALLFLLTFLYIACIDWAGFTITTFVFLALGMLLLSGRERKNKVFVITLAAGLAIGGYLLFVVAFERHFPEGPFEHAFKAVMHAAEGH
jgi:Tripartite tricarboxylate transporter TctB family